MKNDLYDEHCRRGARGWSSSRLSDALGLYWDAEEHAAVRESFSGVCLT